MKIEVTNTERTTIVAALMDYGFEDLAYRIGLADTADDGPEIDILRRQV